MLTNVNIKWAVSCLTNQTYSVSHNFIYPYLFAGNQGNHQNFVPSHTVIWRGKNELSWITLSSPHYSYMLFRCFLTESLWILCRLKNWGLPWPLGVLFTLLLVAGLVFLYCKICASRLEKRLLKARGGLNSLTCIKFIIFLLKNI